jgi:hypothetical protein
LLRWRKDGERCARPERDQPVEPVAVVLKERDAVEGNRMEQREPLAQHAGEIAWGECRRRLGGRQHFADREVG